MEDYQVKKIDSWLLNLFFITLNFGIIVTPVIFSLINQELFEFPKMLVVYSLAALTTGWWLARIILNKRLLLPNSKLDLPILVFFITQLLATVFSIHPYTSIFGYYSRFNGGLLSTLAYCLIYFNLAGTLTHLHSDQPKKAQKMIKLLLLTIVITGVITALYALPEKFGHSPSCLFATGEFNTDCWKESTNPKYRIFGTFGQPNWLAAFLLTVWPISLIPLAQSVLSKKKSRFLISSLISSVILLWAVWLTDSRSGFLALLGGFGTFLILLFLSKKTISRLAKTIAFSSMIIILALGGFFAQNWWQQSQNIKPIGTGGSDSGAIRRVVWSGAIEIFKHHPWIGTGPETFAYSYYQFRPIEHNLLSEWDFLYNKAHNEWLNFLANSGILGFLGFFWVQLTMILVGLEICRVGKKNPVDSLSTKIITASLVAGLIGLQISNFFGFSTVAVSLVEYLLLAVLACLWQTTRETEQKVVSQWPKKQTFSINLLQKLALALLFILEIMTQKAIFNIWQADTTYTQGLELLQTGYLELGSQKIVQAIKQRPQEALFYDNLADQYADFAQTLNSQDEKDGAQELAQLALTGSDTALKLNPYHLNFYKTRIRILTKLAELNQDFVNQALVYAVQAKQLAPTDAKLAYNQAKIELYLDKTEDGTQHLKETLQLKPDYPEPRFDLAQLLLTSGQLPEAKANYQYILDHLNNQDVLSLKQIQIIDASLSAKVKN